MDSMSIKLSQSYLHDRMQIIMPYDHTRLVTTQNHRMICAARPCPVLPDEEESIQWTLVNPALVNRVLGLTRSKTQGTNHSEPD
jgi:hypothetical protein